MPGFYVKDGVLMEAGKEIREFGLNVPDLLLSWLGNSDSAKVQNSTTPVIYQTNYAANFDTIIGLGFRVVRFSLFGLRPLTFQKTWVEQRNTYLSKLDALVASAEVKGIRLIPSLFWSATQFAPYFSEHLNAIGDPTSATYAAMQEITSTIVARYKNSPAIAMWEFGNEYDGQIGINGQFVGLNATAPSNGYSVDATMGTPSAWTYPQDGLVKESVYTAMSAFQAVVKAVDSAPAYAGEKASRATASGNNGYRFRKVVKSFSEFFGDRFEDDKTDTLGAHPYESSDYYDTDYGGFETYLTRMVNSGRAAGKPYIIGEFGVNKNYAGSSRLYSQQQARIASNIATAGVQLALLWLWPAVTGTDGSWSFRADEATGNRGAELTFLSELNKIYKAR